MIELAISLGIVLSLVSIETLGLAAGGIIVPGYIALQLGTPIKLVGLLLVTGSTFLSLKLIGQFTFLFGRRQMVVSLLIGTIYSIIAHQYLLTTNTPELSPIGWVLPGLIAHWSVKQGFLKTVSMLIVMATIVRMILIIAYSGQQLPQFYL